jgi:hypothetical protein
LEVAEIKFDNIATLFIKATDYVDLLLLGQEAGHVGKERIK